MASRADVARKLAGARIRPSSAAAFMRTQAAAARAGRSIDRIQLTAPNQPTPRPATEAEALGLPPFGRAVELICNAIAGTDWYARRPDPEDPGVWERLAEQPAIVTNPYPLQTLWSYKWAVAEDGILYGNHFALLGETDWRTGRPGWTVPVAAEDVWLHTDPANPGWFGWAIGGEMFTPDEVLHIPFGSRSGSLLGRGVLAQYADWLGGAREAEDYSRDTFAAGALPPAVITTSQVATQEQADELKSKWRGIVETREPVVLPNGTELKPVVGNAEQAQLVQARTWNAQAIANVIGVPGWKLGLDGPTMTYQNVETGDIDFVRDSVDRFARPIAEALSKWLLPGGTELVWDYGSRMRADQKTAAEVTTMYVREGILTIDEARAIINRPPLPEPDPRPSPGPDGERPPAGADQPEVGTRQSSGGEAAAAAIAQTVPTTSGGLS